MCSSSRFLESRTAPTGERGWRALRFLEKRTAPPPKPAAIRVGPGQQKLRGKAGRELTCPFTLAGVGQVSKPHHPTLTKDIRTPDLSLPALFGLYPTDRYIPWIGTCWRQSARVVRANTRDALARLGQSGLSYHPRPLELSGSPKTL